MVFAIGESFSVLSRLFTALTAVSIPVFSQPEKVSMAPFTAGLSRKSSRLDRPSVNLSKIGCPTVRSVLPTQSRRFDDMPVKVLLCFAIMPLYFSFMTLRSAVMASGKGEVRVPDLSNSTPIFASCSRVTMPSSWKRMIASPVAPALNLPR